MSTEAKLAAVLIACLICAMGGFRAGVKLKQGEWDAATVKAQQADQSAQKDTGHAIAKSKSESVRVVTRVKTVTREAPVYRDAACSHDQRVYDDLNRSLSGSGDSVVPSGSGSAPGSDDGRDHGQAD